MLKRHHRRLALLALLVTLAFAMTVSFALGRYPLSVSDVVKTLYHGLIGNAGNGPEATIIFNVRLPRILLAALVGAGLAVSGVTFQALFQNPMVSPDVLGATSGAGFGAALGILLGMGSFGITLTSFAFGIVSIALVLLISTRIRRGNKILGLILTGIVVGSLFSAMLSFLKLVADPTNELPAITFWLMGSLAGAAKIDLIFAAPFILCGIALIGLLRWRLNVLTLGDDVAKTLGSNATKIRILLLLASTLITAAAVSVSGMIGWIGLVIPHFARIIVGSDHRYSVPTAALCGSIFLILIDNIARLATTSEIPLGILTSFIGAPFFLYLILKMGKNR